MADKDTSNVDTRRYDKSLNEDVNDYHLPENEWTHARNAINNSRTGDVGKLGNEPANILCIEILYPNNPVKPSIIGALHIVADKWLIYSTTDIDHEIGVFQEDTCTYTKLVNDKCLGFNKKYIIKGVVRATSTCTYKAYWDDGNNISRILEFDADNLAVNAYTNENSSIPWVQTCIDDNGILPGGCIICTNTPALDCPKLRLARYIKTPCVYISKGVQGGTLFNGSYMIAVAYAIDGVKVSDWYVSNVQGLFEHRNNSSSIDVALYNLDQTFDQIQIAIIYVVSQQTVARLAGIYSTRQQNLSFDNVDYTLPVVPIENIPIMNPVVNKTDAMYSVGDYLIRSGPTSKEDFNYQPLANQIVAKWQSVEYPIDYYRKGGNKTNYMRDEVYPLFIRWVFDTGDMSSAYHIPGRPSFVGAWNETGTTMSDALSGEYGNTNPIDNFNYVWYIRNTAFFTAVPAGPVTTSDGGTVVAEGLMGYWESSEYYPDNKPQIWNANTNPLAPGFNTPVSPYASFAPPGGGTSAVSEIDLCGKPIRHHKFPDLSLLDANGNNLTDTRLQYYNPANGKIRILGIAFENIKAPLMNDGITPVPGIVGYEIMRGARNGNKTILAKGLINNMRLYDLKGTGFTGVQGAYPNYPYNELRPDPFLTQNQVEGGGCDIQNNPIDQNEPLLNGVSRDLVTFHSPDTTFTDPYLSAQELKIHGEMNGDVTGKFELSEEHPKEKLITNTSFFIAAIAGIGLAAVAANGKKTTKYLSPKTPGYSESNVPRLTTWGAFNGVGPVTVASSAALLRTSPTYLDNLIRIGLAQTNVNAGYVNQNASTSTGVYTASALLAQTPQDTPFLGYDGTLGMYGLNYRLANDTTKAVSSRTKDIDQELGETAAIPQVLRYFVGLPIFINNFTQAADKILDFFKAVIRYRDFALRYHSHCFYDKYQNNTNANSRRYEIQDAQYLGPQITNFSSNVTINNLSRAKTVAVKVNPNKQIQDPSVDDVTRIPASAVDALWEPEFSLGTTGTGPDVLKNPYKESFGRSASGAGYGANSTLAPGNSGIQIASSNYVSLKQRIRNQYGQINGVNIVPTDNCVNPTPATGQTAFVNTVFGGDTYIGRYTEKNTFYYFYNWLYGQPDGAQWDYKKNVMIPYPKFFANFDKFETGDFIQSTGNIFNPSNWSGGFSGLTSSLVMPSDYYNLDGKTCSPGNLFNFSAFRFAVRYQWFYLFNSGVKDFFVESEINIDHRDWGDLIEEQHYDPYRFTDTRSMFNTKIIRENNYYKYDQSLSIAKLFINYASWASVQQISYNPYIAETCFIYNPTRVIYSLPAVFESVHDSWTNFLANNYYDFNTRVTCIKPVNKNGALIFFEGESPAQFFGTDQLQTTGGTKLTIGDGGLFDQPLQNIVNADRPYEYASCQDRLCVINTPAGVYWISQNQSKIFNFAGGLTEVSMQDMKWWLINYLPYKLTEQFPDFNLFENPVIGLGTQSIYDNQNGLLYFCKRDFTVRTDLPPGITIEYINDDNFNILLNGVVQHAIKLGDLNYFEDASWTLSYDPKTKGWVSYHDWHPNLMLPGKNTFLTVKGNSIWIHNSIKSTTYCNYYGIDYPFEIEYLVDTIQNITTLRSIEYQLEVYKYAQNNFDRFHVLDFNFDEAVVYNTEQVSGLLKLNLTPRKDPMALIVFPKTNFNNIDILYSKVENKFRFNQFWDITADRGEYNVNAQRMIWNTGTNGYNRVLNPNNMNYAKDEFQRKKFRHYLNYVFLRKNVCGDRKMLILFTNNKDLYSPR
tara:strand:+ start:12057 stop:17363 length:5307 start_codon:yes stop_codon:yes gene_type:complete